MLDIRSKLPIADRSQEFDQRISMRRSPSFGLGSLRSRKKLLGFSTTMFLAMGLLYALHRPTTYTASSQLLVYIKRILTGSDLAVLPGRADLPLVQNQIELLRSGNVLVKLVETLQAELQAKGSSDQLMPSGKVAFSAALDAVRTNLSVRQVGTSHLITVKFTASEPEKAAQIVNKLIRIYLQELSRASDAGSSKAPVLRESYQSLGPSAYLISEAEPPIRADGPVAALIVMGAALFGLGVAAILAILLDAINDTIRNSRQLEYALGLECLGVIPDRADMNVGGSTELPHTIEGRALRRAVATLLDASSHGLRTIGVTSAVPGEGTTTLAVGLARAMAVSGKRVLVIDGCPENPSISRWAANAPQIPGWWGGNPRSGAPNNRVEVQTRLHVLPFGEQTDREPRSICSASLDEILRGVADIYDFVIVDMPALAAGPDVRAAAQALDGFLLVVKWGSTESELVQQALHSAGEARPKFVGAVLNMADEKTMRCYGDKLPSELKVATAS